jgi:uncharacterized protein (TIRG00374 family)
VTGPAGAESPAPKRRFRIGPLLQWGGTIALGWFVLSKTDLAAIGRVAAGADVRLLAVAVALYVLDRVTAAHRWRILYVAFGHPLGLWKATRVYLESSFLGAALPATVGGDIIRARMVATGGTEFAHAVGSVVMERLLGTLALVVCAGLGVALFSPHSSWGTTVPSLAVAAGVVAAGAALVFSPPVPASVLARTRGWPRKALEFLIDVHERVRGYGRRPGAVTMSAAIGFAQQYLFMTINWVLALALGIALDLGAVLWMWPFVMLAMRLPISFLGFGIREAVLLGFFAGAGLSPESAVSLGILSGLLDLIFIGAGGLLLVLEPAARKVDTSA